MNVISVSGDTVTAPREQVQHLMKELGVETPDELSREINRTLRKQIDDPDEHET